MVLRTKNHCQQTLTPLVITAPNDTELATTLAKNTKNAKQSGEQEAKDISSG